MGVARAQRAHAGHAAARTALACTLALALAVQLPGQALASALGGAADGAAQLDYASSVGGDEEAAQLVAAALGAAADGQDPAGTAVGTADGACGEAGAYRLAEDLVLDDPLQLAAAAGATVVFDLAGHELRVEGQVACAIDASANEGTVLIIDTTAFGGDTAQEEGGSIVCAPAGDAGAEGACVIDAGAPAGDDDVNAQESALVLAGVALELDCDAGAQPEQACAVELRGGHAYVGEGATFRVDGLQAAALICFAQDAVSLLAGYAGEEPLRISVADAQEGSVLAHMAAGVEDEDACELALVGADGLEAVLEDGGRYIARSADATQAQDDADGAAASGQLAVAGSDANAEGGSSLAALATAVDGTDLNAAWEASGTGSEYTIGTGGTYYLSDDLAVSSRLVISASGQDVTIEFAGHTLTGTSGSGVVIQADAAASVVLAGDGSGTSAIVLAGSAPNNAVKSAADELVISDLCISVRTDDDETDLKDLGATAVRATAGTVAFSGCSLAVDLSNQGNTTVTSGNSSLSGGPAAVYLASGVVGASLSACVLTVSNSAVVYDYSSSSGTVTGYAHGLYSATTGAVSIDGCDISVTSALGTAKGIEACNATIAGEGASITLTAANYVIGVSSLAQQGVTLDGPLAVAAYDCAPAYEAALYGSVEDAFAFDGGFAAESQLAVWVGSDEDTANDDGAVVGSFASGVAGATRQAVLGMLANALGEDAPCELQLSSGQIVFSLDAGKAPVELVSASGATVAYASAAAALAAMASGETLHLLADVGQIAFGIGSAGESYAIDLDGHTAAGLVHSSAADLVVASDGTGGIEGLSSKGNAGVYASGSGALSMSALSVTCVSTTSEAYGIYLTSTCALTLEDVDVSVSSSATQAQAVRASSSSGAAVSIEGGSLSVRALAYGVIAKGVGVATKSAALTIEDCPIAVQGVSSQTRGIEFASELVLVGSAGTSTVDVSTATAVSGTVGVVATATGSSASFTDCSIDVQGCEDAETPYWCVSNGGGSYEVALSFAGTTRLQSSTDTAVQHYSTPLVLAADVVLDQDELVVNTLGTSSAAFAQAASSLDVLSLLGVFAAYGSGSYAGCTAVQQGIVADGVATLAWQGSADILNVTTSATYNDLAAAIAAAADGDTLRLRSDVRVNASVTATASITLDLDGFTLTSAAAGGAGGSGSEAAALVASGAQLTLCDGAGGGGLVIGVGKANDASTTTYRGISVTDGGSLSLEGVAVSVTYTGGSLSTNPKLKLYGICLDTGALSLVDGASLRVVSAPEQDAFGASDVLGVYVAAGSEGDVAIAEGCSIGVVNDSLVVQTGSSDYPDDYLSSNATSSSNVQMLELDVQEGGELYEMIQEQFIEQAECDNSNDSQGKLFGANIYYVTNMELPNGLHVWAYSDQVADSDLGKPDCVVATHVFVRAPYNRANNAYGVYAASGCDASIAIAGQVSVETGLGEAYGAYATSYDTWSYDENDLYASCSEDSYLTLAKSTFDLNDYIDISGFESTTIAYPSNASMKTVAVTQPIAQGLYDTSVTAAADALSEDGLYGLLYPAMEDTVTVSFENLRDEDGTMLDGVDYVLAYGSTLSTAGCEDPQPCDYVDDGTTYRFVGWKLTGGDYTYDAGVVYEGTAMDSNVSGATGGSVVYSAVYVPVGAGQHLVTFRVEDTVSAYPVDDGDAASYLACNSSAGVAAPGKVSSVSGYSFTFAGWAEEDSGECIKQDGDVLRSALLAASADVTYTARFNQILSTSTVRFYTQAASDGSLVTRTTSFSDIDWTQSITDTAAGVASIGDSFNCQGVIYTFAGWAPRQSDTVALYTTEELWAAGFAQGYAENNYFFAVYEQADQLVSVSFHAYDGTLLATTEALKASLTIAQAFATTGLDTSTFSAPGEEMRFRGWNTSADADSILLASVSTLYDVCGEAEELALYAIWGPNQYTVTFLNTDGSTLGSATVDYGTTVEESNPNFSLGLTGKAARLFAGWQFADGTSFSTSETIVTEDIEVYAVFNADTASAGSALALASGSGNALASGAGSLDSGSLAANALSLASGALSSSALSLSGGSLEGADGELAASAVQAAASADALQAADDALAEDGAAGDGTLASRLALACLALALAAVVAFVLRWFVLRLKREDDEAVVAADAPGAERIRF